MFAGLLKSLSIGFVTTALAVAIGGYIIFLRLIPLRNGDDCDFPYAPNMDSRFMRWLYQVLSPTFLFHTLGYLVILALFLASGILWMTL